MAAHERTVAAQHGTFARYRVSCDLPTPGLTDMTLTRKDSTVGDEEQAG